MGEKDFLGRGSLSVKTDILRDMVIVSLQGILTPAEYRVCKTNEGLLNIKRTRSELVESGEEDLSRIIKDLTGLNVKSFHSDLSTITGERVMIFKFYLNYCLFAYARWSSNMIICVRYILFR